MFEFLGDLFAVFKHWRSEEPPGSTPVSADSLVSAMFTTIQAADRHAVKKLMALTEAGADINSLFGYTSILSLIVHSAGATHKQCTDVKKAATTAMLEWATGHPDANWNAQYLQWGTKAPQPLIFAMVNVHVRILRQLPWDRIDIHAQCNGGNNVLHHYVKHINTVHHYVKYDDDVLKGARLLVHHGSGTLSLCTNHADERPSYVSAVHPIREYLGRVERETAATIRMYLLDACDRDTATVIFAYLTNYPFTQT
jgi:hypothetical protein